MLPFLLSPLGKVAGIAVLVLAAFLGVKVWLHSHDSALLSGYVLLSEKTAAEATTKEMKRQRDAAQSSLDAFQKNLDAARQSEQQAKDTLENELSAFQLQLSEKNRQCLADSADLDFIRRH